MHHRAHPYSNDRHKNVLCPECGKSTRSNNLNRHLLTHNARVECRHCQKQIREDRLTRHETLCKDQINESLCDRTTGVHQHLDITALPHRSSVFGFFKSFELQVGDSKDYDDVIRAMCDAAKPIIEATVAKHPIKAQLLLSLSFYKHADGERRDSEKVFRSHCEPILLGDSIEEYLRRATIIIREGIELYERHGSGWLFDKAHSGHLEMAKCLPLA